MLNYFYTDSSHTDIVDIIVENQYSKALNEWETKKKEGTNQGKKPNKKYIENNVHKNKEKLVPGYSLALKSSLFIDKYLRNRYINNFSVKSLSIWISDMRNRKSHGSKNSIGPYEIDYLSEEEKQLLEKLRKKLEELVDQYNKDHDAKIKFQNNRLNPFGVGWKNVPEDVRNIYNDHFSPLQFVHEESFNCVHDFLKIIAGTCAKNL